MRKTFSLQTCYPFSISRSEIPNSFELQNFFNLIFGDGNWQQAEV